jgi:hypothetical protein
MPGVTAGSPFCFAIDAPQLRKDRSHETSIEWDGHCCRPGYCCASVGANRSANDAIAQRAVSAFGADGIDGVA